MARWTPGGLSAWELGFSLAFSMSRAELRRNRCFLVVGPTISSREPPEQLTRTMLIDEYCISAFQGALQASSLGPPLCRAFSMSRAELRTNRGFLVVVPTIPSREPPEQLTRTMLIDEYCNSAFQGILQASSLEPPLCRAFSMSRAELRKNRCFRTVSHEKVICVSDWVCSGAV